MNKILSLIVIFTLTACASSSSSSSEWVKADNTDIAQLNDCGKLEYALESSKLQLSKLKEAKNWQNTGNALAVGSALLSLNPTMLFNMGRTNKMNESIQSYEERVQMLQNKLQQSCKK